MAQRLLITTDFPKIQTLSVPVIETVYDLPEKLSTPWYNDLSHDITDSTVFRCLLIIVVFDHIWKWLK